MVKSLTYGVSEIGQKRIFEKISQVCSKTNGTQTASMAPTTHALYIWLGGRGTFVYDGYHTHKNNQSVFKICIHSTIGLSSVNDIHLFPLCQFLLLATMVSQQMQRMKVPIDGNVKEVQSGEHNEKKTQNLDCARKKLFVDCQKKRLQVYRN